MDRTASARCQPAWAPRAPASAVRVRGRAPALKTTAAAVADADAPAETIQPVLPREDLKAGIAGFYDESSGLWESMW
jgi:hypothetical protein